MKEIMERLGFALSGYYEASKTYSYQKEPRYHIEIHCQLEDTDKPEKLAFLETLLEHPTADKGSRLRFCDEDLYIHTLFHLYKHFLHSGAGVKMFLDIFVLSRVLQIDMDHVDQRLQTIGLDGFNRAVLRECDVLFCGALIDADMRLLTEKILFDSAFGKREGGWQRSKILLSDHPARTGRELIWDSVGAGKKNMTAKYPILLKAPILTPLCHIHRAVKGVITKPRVAVSSIKRIGNFLSVKKIKRQNRVLSAAGIKPDPKKRSE